MIIKSVELENLRSYKKEVINFDRGINFLSGDIGSGKSTILLAIEFAFFGFKRGDLEGYQLLRKGAREGSVKLILTDKDNNEVEIYRKVKKGKTNDNISQENGYIKIDNSLVELSPQELNSKVFEILNFPKEFITKDKNLVYRFTIYTPQEQLKEILFSENEKKLEIIRKIFNVDKYKQLSDAISIYLSKIKVDKKIYESKLENKGLLKEEVKLFISNVENLKKELEQFQLKEKPLKEKLAKCKEAISKREEYLEKFTGAILKIEKRLTLIDEAQKSLRSLEKEIKDREEFLSKNSKLRIEEIRKVKEDEIKNLSKKLEDLNQKSKKSQDIEKEFERLYNEKENLLKKLSEINEKRELLKNYTKNFDYVLTKCQLKDAQVQLKKLILLVKKSDKIEEDIDKIKESLNINKNEVRRFEKELSEKENFEEYFGKLSECPVCLQEVDEKHRSKVFKSVKVECKEFRLKIVELEKAIKVDSKLLSEKQEVFENIKLAQREIDILNEKIRALEEKEKSEKEMYDKVKVLKSEILKLENLKVERLIKEIEKKIEEVKNLGRNSERILDEITVFTEKINKLKFEILEIENSNKDVERVKKEILEIQKKIEENTQIINKREEFEIKLLQIKEKEKSIREQKRRLNDMLEVIYDKEKQLAAKLVSLKTQIESKTTEQETKKKILDEMIVLEKEFENLIKNESFLSDKVVRISEMIEKAVFTKYYIDFNEEFERLFRELIEDNDIEVRLDEEFSIIVEQNGFDIDIKNLSGGEKSSLAVAYRLGLKKVIENSLQGQKLDILILDEPTDGFSNEQIDRLGNILRESDLEQIILVSHDEKIESIADSVFHINKVNHISTVS